MLVLDRYECCRVRFWVEMVKIEDNFLSADGSRSRWNWRLYDGVKWAGLAWVKGPEVPVCCVSLFC